MWNKIGRVAFSAAKIVGYKVLGEKPTEEIIQLINDLRKFAISSMGGSLGATERRSQGTAAGKRLSIGTTLKPLY